METIACSLCGADHARVVLQQRDLTHGISNEEFTVVRCAGCGLLYLNPRPTPAEIGRYYPPQYFPAVLPRPQTGLKRSTKRLSGAIKRWIMEDFYNYPTRAPLGWWRWLRKLLLWPEKIRRVFRGREILPWVEQGRLLDVGCGPGVNLATLRSQGWDVYGLDTSAVAVTCAREQFGDRVQLGDLGSVQYKDRSFDVVLFSHSLEHLFDPLAALTEVRRILNDQGLVVITLPNAGSLEARLFGQWWFPWELPRHLYHFEKTTLTRLLEQAGFDVVRVRTGVGSLFFMTSLERFWTHRFGRAIPARRAIEKLVARPFCLAAGHLGYGTEITVYAVKARSVPERHAPDTSAAGAAAPCG